MHRLRHGATDPTQDASSPMMQLQGQLQANQVEITNREQAIAELKAKSTTTRPA